MEVKSLLKTACLLLVLVNCSGGGDSSPSIIAPPAQNAPSQPLFNQTPIKLLDAVSYYAEACNNPSFQFLIPTKN